MSDHYRSVIHGLMRHGFSFKRLGTGSHEIWGNRQTGDEVSFDRHIGSRKEAASVLDRLLTPPAPVAKTKSAEAAPRRAASRRSAPRTAKAAKARAKVGAKTGTKTAAKRAGKTGPKRAGRKSRSR